MGVLITCTNKGCFDNDEHPLDPASNEVICKKCGKPIKDVTIFMKTQLKTLGQTFKNAPQTRAFTYQCKKCGQFVKPIINKVGQVLCPCGAEMNHLPAPIQQMLRLKI